MIKLPESPDMDRRDVEGAVMENDFKRSGGMRNKVIRPYSHRRLLQGEARPFHHRCQTAAVHHGRGGKKRLNTSFKLFKS